MSKVIIFGTGDNSSLADFFLTKDSPQEVVAFTVNRKYVGNRREFRGKPLVAFEDVQDHFPPGEHAMFAPLYAGEMNGLRERVFRQGLDKGYSFVSYVASSATVWTEDIGANCFILDGNVLQPFSRVEDNVVMWSGNHLGHHSVVGRNAFVTGHVCISGHCTIGEYAFLAPGVTVRDHVTVGAGCLVGMGAAVIANTDPWSVYQGVPAKKVEGKYSKTVKL